MKMRILSVLAAAALLPLAACNNQPEVVDSRAPDPMAEAIKNAPPVDLPPPVEATVTFRCQPGNVLRFVDFFKGGMLANLRTEKGGAPTQLKAPAAGEPYVGSAYTLTGDAKAATIAGEGGTLTCKA